MVADSDPGAAAEARADAAGDEPVPLEVLEHKLTSWAANIAAAEAKWLRWLGEYDLRQGWAEWGCVSAANWLSWKCGMTSSVARERVRVAAALLDLPLIQAEFSAGRLSYSKVRALTRVATVHNEPDLCDMALHASGAQLEAICRGYRRSHPDRVDDTGSAHARRRFSVRENYDGTTTLTVVLPADAARSVVVAVNAHADAIIADAASAGDLSAAEAAEQTRTKRQVIDSRDGIAAVRADACHELLTGAATASLTRPTDLTMVVPPHHAAPSAAPRGGVSAETPPVDVSAETSAASGAAYSDQPVPDVSAETGSDTAVLQRDDLLPNEVAQRVCCDPRITALIESATGEPLAVGRATRLISHHVRLALHRRDAASCQFPGCFATHNLHAHHIIHWAHGGPTELGNLVLVCHFHHHLIHDRGWSVDPTTRHFISPGEQPLDSRPTSAISGGNALAINAVASSARAIEPRRWRGDSGGHHRPGPIDDGHAYDMGSLEPPHLHALDLGLAVLILHTNEQSRHAAAHGKCTTD